MKRRTGIIAALALAATASAGWAAPKIEFISKTTHDFKTVYQGTPVAYGFFFRSAGDETLVIHDVLQCCGVTAKAVPDRIAPGKQGKISVIFDTGRYRGQQYKTVTVKTSDPGHKEVTLAFSGTVKVAVAIEPSPFITLGQLTTADKRMRTITVVPVEKMKAFKITKIDTAVPYLHVSKPRPSKRKEGGFDISVTLGPRAPAGRIAEDIKIHTNHKKQPTAVARVHANVVAAA